MNHDLVTLDPAPILERHHLIFFTCLKGTGTFFIETNQIKFANSSKPVNLAYSAGKAFEILIRNAGKVIYREDIFEYAWAGRVVTQNSLNQVISQLREAIGDDTDKQVIRTVSRKGYVFGRTYLADAAVVTDVIAPPTDIVTPSPSSPPPLGKDSTFVHFFQRDLKLSRRTFYLIVMLGSLALWLLKIDFGLLFSAGFASDTQTYNNTQVIYVAPSEPGLKPLKARVEQLVHQLDSQNWRDKVIVINDSLGYYDIYCLKAAESPRFIVLSKDVSLDLPPDIMKRCLK